ncbi:MAG: transcription-repair coupling factor [Pyrinomonadaceae bacterium]
MPTLNYTSATLDRLAKEIDCGTRIVSVAGLTSTSAKSFVLDQLRAKFGRPMTVITDTNAGAEKWERDLRFWSDRTGSETEQIVTLPCFETDVYSGVSPHAETQERRALALWRMSRADAAVAILPAKSLITRIPLRSKMQDAGKDIIRDLEIAPDDLIDSMVSGGYVREEPLTNVGQFSIRGGIIDIWPPNSEVPVRIEFFGDTVESIREFDIQTQLSTGQLNEIAIAPMREFSGTAKDLKEWCLFAAERFSNERFARNLKDRADFASEGETFSGWEFLLPLSKPPESTVFEYVGDSLLVIDEPVVVEQTLASYYDQLEKNFTALREANDIGLEPAELFISALELRERLETATRLEFRALGRSAARSDDEFQNETGMTGSVGKPSLFLFPAAERSTELEFRSRSNRKFYGDIRAFAAELDGSDSQQLFVFNTVGMVERFEEVTREFGLQTSPGVIGDLSGGFEMPELKLRVVTESDIFGETSNGATSSPKSPGKSSRSNLGAFISDFRDLKPTDYVVHVDHGIGRFEGLQTLDTGGISREFMLLVYSDKAKLFVPVERLDLVSRYSSGEAASPTLDRLGGIGWQKTKAKAKRAMRDMADELLKLYAERKLVPGHAFSADAPWQHEFEDAFPYDLTIDQASAITDVKVDMETPIPMDRLIIGDVGYGKTEVAMRAVFKAVMDGTQAAVLAPTTVLAYQHYETFQKRFAAFPIKVDLLSRFRSAKEQKVVVENVNSGKVDVLIGTHRILSNDIAVPKLGLVVVDEEQRFGVGHKEKLKQLKKKVDVLTLSATPIPRTLNMSLLGMRDMSVIETPPRDRLAINTQVVQFSESVIRSAIDVELARDGQVFFIHNRVETIEAIAALVQSIVPNARIAIGHGQMNEKEMEQVMLDFIDYKYDILVATTIIENGIDIPRANTIIINRADNYGLSQLYQLRGRVGRSNRRAYAYLLIPSEIELTPIARRRLSAIREFSDLGAGFRLAALDLELRGAGNILGGQQSGHLDALGFDLYTKMLERTIAEIRGDEIADETSVSINLGVDVSIPKEYISDTGQRLRTYKRISSAESEEGFQTIYAEIEDRYGRIPESIDNLFDYGRLRKLAERLRVISIDKTADGFAVKLSENARMTPDKLMDFVGSHADATFSPTGILRVASGPGEILTLAQSVLESLSDD